MNRFETPEQGLQVHSEYDLPSDEVQDLISRAVSPIRVYTDIDLSQAGTKLIQEPGYGFVLYAQISGLLTKYSEAFINVAVNRGDLSDPSVVFPAKNNRGYRGAFSQLYLSWPQDSSGTYLVSFLIFKSRKYPWIGGEEAE